MSQEVVDYFSGDSMASDVWSDKYCLKDSKGTPVESTPKDMHWRMAREFARIEFGYIERELTNDARKLNSLSNFGQQLYWKRASQRMEGVEAIEQEFFNYFDKFGQIVPQGSIMSNLGNFFIYGSLSNCFGIASPYDSYGGIMKTDEQIAQLEKRRGGVGCNISTIRPEGSLVANSAKTSTGVVPIAERYSNTTREVAQNGRRGALMLLLMCAHPEVFSFASMKDDRTKVTGANVSIMFTEEFMQALEEGKDFVCRFPIDVNFPMTIDNETYEGPINVAFDIAEYNKIQSFLTKEYGTIQLMKIKPQELFDLVAEMAWKNAEPGVAYYDRVVDYSPEGVYPQYRAVVANPCAEQWFAANETCRLIALNFWGIVNNHFETEAAIDYEKLYELAYMQQRLGDNLVDLECEYIDRILDKISKDPEPMDIKYSEWKLWIAIKKIAEEGRRTGGGFTALGDMLAALGVKYDDDYALATVEEVMKTKMRAELDCTIDMAILRGPFVGWDSNKEFQWRGNVLEGRNSFFEMIAEEFQEQAQRMYKYARRNTNWSTVAPTGTVSLMTRTTSGLEPLFKAYYIRRKKINPSEPNSRVDFVDDLGDKWQEYAVLHPKFKKWIEWWLKDCIEDWDLEKLTKNNIEMFFKESPWYKSEADDISWEKRIDMQAIIQRYTSNAISSTINLPQDVPQQVVKDIYLRAYHKGLKGVTVYRDGSRSGVLITETKVHTDKFGYSDAVKRPKELEAHYYTVRVKGDLFAVVVGLLDGLPYELFAFENPILEGDVQGKLIKIKRGVYEFRSNNYTIENVELAAHRADETNLTRFCSQMLRHGVNPKHIVEQVEKSKVTIVSFPKAIAKVLKRYIPDEATGEICNECKQPSIIYEEGCKKCTSCGSSKC